MTRSDAADQTRLQGVTGEESCAGGDGRWPLWASMLFIATWSLVLWALIVAGLWCLALSE